MSAPATEKTMKELVKVFKQFVVEYRKRNRISEDDPK